MVYLGLGITFAPGCYIIMTKLPRRKANIHCCVAVYAAQGTSGFCHKKKKKSVVTKENIHAVCNAL